MQLFVFCGSLSRNSSLPVCPFSSLFLILDCVIRLGRIQTRSLSLLISHTFCQTICPYLQHLRTFDVVCKILHAASRDAKMFDGLPSRMSVCHPLQRLRCFPICFSLWLFGGCVYVCTWHNVYFFFFCQRNITQAFRRNCHSSLAQQRQDWCSSLLWLSSSSFVTGESWAVKIICKKYNFFY